MKYILKTLSLCLICIHLLSGCGIAYRVLLGVDSRPNWNSDKSIRKQAKRYHIPDKDNLIMDTAAYFNGLHKHYSEIASSIVDKQSKAYTLLQEAHEDDGQPTQFRLFEKDGKEIFKIVNCYVDPPIPMNWNVQNCFDQFPPKINIESLNEHHFDLNFLLGSAHTMANQKITLNDFPQADYYGVVIWNQFFKRPSRKLIKTVRGFTRDSGKSIHLIFIHNQNAYLWHLIDDKTKEKVKRALQKRK